MGKLVVTEFVSLDGVFEDPGGADTYERGWSFAHDRGPERRQVQTRRSDALGAGDHFQHAVESPYEDFDDDFRRPRACEITLDRSTSNVKWRVDGHPVYEAHGTLIPERVQIGFGIWTMLPIRDGRSCSLKGQGMGARWHRFRLRGVDA